MSDDRPYADPQDLAFGESAKEKEETLDEERFEAEPSEPLEAVEEGEEAPRPGAKAEPTD